MHSRHAVLLPRVLNLRGVKEGRLSWCPTGCQAWAPQHPRLTTCSACLSAAGKGPYQGAGPYIMRAKLSELSDVGEGISLPPFASQASPLSVKPCATQEICRRSSCT